ncbi:TMhelix containing protein [Vibrio phage 1.173.O._10N.261.55.A11]|nr:TMhelix containing protein [Vibrio phage 1.173.O._10N.261.55.A11]
MDSILIGAIVGIGCGILGGHHGIGLIPTLAAAAIITLLLVI